MMVCSQHTARDLPAWSGLQADDGGKVETNDKGEGVAGDVAGSSGAGDPHCRHKAVLMMSVSQAAQAPEAPLSSHKSHKSQLLPFERTFQSLHSSCR